MNLSSVDELLATWHQDQLIVIYVTVATAFTTIVVIQVAIELYRFACRKYRFWRTRRQIRIWRAEDERRKARAAAWS